MQKNTRFFQAVMIHLLAAMPFMAGGQVVVGSGTPDGSAVLEVQGNNRGVLLPRMTTTQRNAISAPANGLIIYNTTTNCMEVNVGTTASPDWSATGCRVGTAASLNCSGATQTGNLITNNIASGVTISVPYTGGNDGAYDAQSIVSYEVTGLTATLAAGTFSSSGGNLVFSISGTPTRDGTAYFPLILGGQTCNLAATVVTTSVTALNCSSATASGIIRTGQSSSGITVSVPYTGGNGGAFNGQTLTSTGVTGLTATLSAGNLAVGAGSLSFALSGTPSGSGAAIFALTIGGQSCSLAVNTGCGAFTAPGVWKEFDCYNLGSNSTSVDPLTPGWQINGGYWQWGVAIQSAAGPSGPGSGQTNEGAVTNWNLFAQPDFSWQDASKATYDPCPVGFKVPTRTQWEGVIANNTYSDLGTWTDSFTNYSSGKKIGTRLMLPAAGLRNYTTGALGSRGAWGYYWSSTPIASSSDARSINFVSGTAVSSAFSDRRWGFSVRCIAE